VSPGSLRRQPQRQPRNSISPSPFRRRPSLQQTLPLTTRDVSTGSNGNSVSSMGGDGTTPKGMMKRRGSFSGMSRRLSVLFSGGSGSSGDILPCYYTNTPLKRGSSAGTSTNVQKTCSKFDRIKVPTGNFINLLIVGTMFFLLLDSRSRVQMAKTELASVEEQEHLFESRMKKLESTSQELKDQVNQLKDARAALEKWKKEDKSGLSSTPAIASNGKKDKNPQLEELYKKDQAVQGQVAHLQRKIQLEAQREVIEKFGEGPYLVDLALEGLGRIRLEMAPLHLMPHTIHVFLEQVAIGLWDRCSFVWNPAHMILASPHVKVRRSRKGKTNEDLEKMQEKLDRDRQLSFVKSGFGGVSFGEYTNEYPHEKFTIGLAGKPGGASNFYINTQDNSMLHGPDGENGADPCFGKVVEGFEILKIMQSRTKRKQEEGWARDAFMHPIFISSARVVNHHQK